MSTPPSNQFPGFEHAEERSDHSRGKGTAPRVEGDLPKVGNSVARLPICAGQQEVLLRAIIRAGVERFGKDIGAHVPGVRFHKREER